MNETMFETIEGIQGMCLTIMQITWKIIKKPRLINHQMMFQCPFRAHWNHIDWVAIASGRSRRKSSNKAIAAEIEKKTKLRDLTSSLFWISTSIIFILVIYVMLSLCMRYILEIIVFSMFRKLINWSWL